MDGVHYAEAISCKFVIGSLASEERTRLVEVREYSTLPQYDPFIAEG
jgi:hypothetical protein